MPERDLPRLGVDGRILESIVTTLNADRSVNISPMGPIVDEQMTRLVLRPFRTSTTYKNLKRSGQGVLHVSDDVELFAQSAIGQPSPPPALAPVSAIDGMMLVDACRWYAFEVESLDDHHERTQIVARTVDRGHNREFFGFNRAKHAVLEAAILATRIEILPAAEIRDQLGRLAAPVEKTGSASERRAFALLEVFVAEKLTSAPREESC